MPKIKTHRGIAKRVKKTATGKMLHRRPFSNHFLSKKSSARKRGYKKTYEIKGQAETNVKRMLGE